MFPRICIACSLTSSAIPSAPAHPKRLYIPALLRVTQGLQQWPLEPLGLMQGERSSSSRAMLACRHWVAHGQGSHSRDPRAQPPVGHSPGLPSSGLCWHLLSQHPTHRNHPGSSSWAQSQPAPSRADTSHKAESLTSHWLPQLQPARTTASKSCQSPAGAKHCQTRYPWQCDPHLPAAEVMHPKIRAGQLPDFLKHVYIYLFFLLIGRQKMPHSSVTVLVPTLQSNSARPWKSNMAISVMFWYPMHHCLPLALSQIQMIYYTVCMPDSEIL